MAATPLLILDTPTNGSIIIHRISCGSSVAAWNLFRQDDTPFNWNAEGAENLAAFYSQPNGGHVEMPLPPGGFELDDSCGLYLVAGSASMVAISMILDRYMEIAP